MVLAILAPTRLGLLTGLVAVAVIGVGLDLLGVLVPASAEAGKPRWVLVAVALLTVGVGLTFAGMDQHPALYSVTGALQLLALVTILRFFYWRPKALPQRA